jgi:hypothetical protein
MITLDKTVAEYVRLHQLERQIRMARHWTRVEYHERFDPAGRVVLAVVVDDWLFDELTAFGTELEDLEPEPNEDDDPAEDEEG